MSRVAFQMPPLFLRQKNKLGTCGLHLFSSGQSLVEAILAVALLTIAIVGAFALLSQVTNAAVQARNRFIAANLAQEGIELIQNIRTTNWVENQDWLTNLSQNTYCTDYRFIQPVCSGTPPTCTSPFSLTSSASACPLFLDASNMYVLANTGTPTIFSRLITLTSGSDGDASTAYLDVQSTITWDNGSRAITAEDRLYNWK